MAELARGDSAISKTFSQNWKWSHLISARLQRRAEGALPASRSSPTIASCSARASPSRTPAPTTACRRRTHPKAGLKLRAERQGDDWILNGEKCFIANAPVGKLFFIDARTDPNAPLRQGTTMFLVARDTPGFRIGKVFNKSGWRFYRTAR